MIWPAARRAEGFDGVKNGRLERKKDTMSSVGYEDLALQKCLLRGLNKNERM